MNLNGSELDNLLSKAVDKANAAVGEAMPAVESTSFVEVAPIAADVALSDDEEAELLALEKAETTRQSKAALAAKRQHLDALRMSARLARKSGEPGRDFVVLETTLGVNIAVRKPLDIEVDELEADDGNEGRAALEKYATAITVEPSTSEIQKLIANHAAVGPTIVRASMKLLDIARKDEAKK